MSYLYLELNLVSLVPSPTPIACGMEKWGGPGTFPHVKDRKTVERPEMNVGVCGSQQLEEQILSIIGRQFCLPRVIWVPWLGYFSSTSASAEPVERGDPLHTCPMVPCTVPTTFWYGRVTPAVPGLSQDSFTLHCYQSIPDRQSYTGSPGIILG